MRAAPLRGHKYLASDPPICEGLQDARADHGDYQSTISAWIVNYPRIGLSCAAYLRDRPSCSSSESTPPDHQRYAYPQMRTHHGSDHREPRLLHLQPGPNLRRPGRDEPRRARRPDHGRGVRISTARPDRHLSRPRHPGGRRDLPPGDPARRGTAGHPRRLAGPPVHRRGLRAGIVRASRLNLGFQKRLGMHRDVKPEGRSGLSL